MTAYLVPAGVEPGRAGWRPTLSLPQGGKFALDRMLLELWQAANSRSLDEIEARFPDRPTVEIRAALACLVSAGLLARQDEPAPTPVQYSTVHGKLLSAAVVSTNEARWLEDCFASLLAQTYQPLELILVDNASQDGSGALVSQKFPSVRILRLEETLPLAGALNHAAQNAQGDYFLILNPDIELAPDAVAEMVSRFESVPDCAAVAPKLKFSWATSVINGIGNRAGAFSWGVDNGLGYLDLGQFDGWGEIPSACFAAMLTSKRVWQAVGPVDEGFTLYYEDTEWSYRARLLGYSIQAAPQAVIYHALSGRIPSGADSGMSPTKLERVVFGRLRFALKLWQPANRLRFVLGYLLEDLLRLGYHLLRGRWALAGAYPRAWSKLLKALPGLRAQRRELQSRRTHDDRQVFQIQRSLPGTLIWHGLPELTWDLIQDMYLPILRTDPPPEFDETTYDLPYSRGLPRLVRIWRQGGARLALHRLFRQIEWYLSRP